MKTRPILPTQGRTICFLLAFVITTILSTHVVRGFVLPVADGEGYAIRAFALYGYLHSGQWDNFWKLLARPIQSILPIHYVPFLLLPRALASAASYVVLQNLVTYLLLAYGVVAITRVLRRPEWSPFLFVICSFNNIAWIDFYSFFLDMQFFALGLTTIAFQMQAWDERRFRASIISGLGLGLLFLLKPANAVIFLVTYILSEIFYWGCVFRLDQDKTGIRKSIRQPLQDWAAKMAGFLPILALALVCGGAQSVLLLIEKNEIHEIVHPIDCGGLLRLFYFPLCLTAFYHVTLLGSLLVAAIIWSRWLPARESQESQIIFLRLFLPVAISYLVFGEFFSFWMSVKPMRAILLSLPFVWLAFSWLWERRRLRIELLWAVGLSYALCVLAQKAGNVLAAKDQLVEDNYQLTISSWVEMPSAWHRGLSLNRIICDDISRNLPPSGVVCVNSIEIRNALAWRLGSEARLQGNPPPYEIRNLFDYKGEYYDKALGDAGVVVLVTFPPVQSSRAAWLNSLGIVDYGNEYWCGASALATQRDLPLVQGEPVGCEFLFARPLARENLDKANASAPFAGMTRADYHSDLDSVYGPHYSWRDGWHLLKTWFRQRFG